MYAAGMKICLGKMSRKGNHNGYEKDIRDKNVLTSLVCIIERDVQVCVRT